MLAAVKLSRDDRSDNLSTLRSDKQATGRFRATGGRAVYRNRTGFPDRNVRSGITRYDQGVRGVRQEFGRVRLYHREFHEGNS